MATYREYELSIPPEAVLQRVRAASRPDLLLGFSTAENEDIVAWTSDRHFRLRVAHWWSNAFAPIVYGRVELLDCGARVVARLSYPRLTTGMLVVWYGVCLLMPLLSLLGVQSDTFQWRGGGNPWLRSLIASAFVFGVSHLTGLINRRDRTQLMEFADRTFGSVRPHEAHRRTAA